jgi:hypothetical protein
MGRCRRADEPKKTVRLGRIVKPFTLQPLNEGVTSRTVLPLGEPNVHGSFRLSDDYVTTATNDVLLQLSRAGVRLATILNQALRKQ